MYCLTIEWVKYTSYPCLHFIVNSRLFNMILFFPSIGLKYSGRGSLEKIQKNSYFFSGDLPLEVQNFHSPDSSPNGHISSRCINFEFHISNRWRQDDGHILHFTLDSSVKSIRWRSCLQKQDVARKSSVLGSDIMHFSFCSFGGAMGVRASEGELIFQNLPKLGLVEGWNCAAGVY